MRPVPSDYKINEVIKKLGHVPFKNHEPKDKMKKVWGYISAGYMAETYIQRAKKLFAERNGREAETFLDMGSGKGGVLLLAHQYGLEATGLEYSQELIDIADKIMQSRKLKGIYKIKTIKGDMMKWVPDKVYDIIYTYWPLQDQMQWLKFLAHLRRVTPSGQIVVSLMCMPEKKKDLHKLGYFQLEPCIYTTLRKLREPVFTLAEPKYRWSMETVLIH